MYKQINYKQTINSIQDINFELIFIAILIFKRQLVGKKYLQCVFY